MSVGAAEQHLCLAQVPVAAKRSGAVALPQVLELVDAAGRVGNLDALVTRPALVARLQAGEADYVLALQQNQRELFAQRQGHFGPCWRRHQPMSSARKATGAANTAAAGSARPSRW